MRISDWSSDVCSSDLDDLGAGIGGVADHALHLPRADHARFVDDEHVARGQQVTPLRPAMFEAGDRARRDARTFRSEEHTSELQSLMRISYAVFCLKKKKISKTNDSHSQQIC